ncbi:MAG: adenylate kinase [Spirochaetaceae bacterium]|nr:MAG: adenylate kinase [Spirochaetaceae bacterium]
MNLVFLGPPGAGKGTMAVRVAEHFSIPHISTGDIFRANIKGETELGKKVKAILDAGNLVPDELTIDLVRDRLTKPDAQNGYILDGFPRTIPQADALAGFSTVTKALNFVLVDEEVVKRLSGRRVHPGSGRTYHVLFSPPKVADTDDVTGEPLVIRPDDQEDAIRNRLEVYRKQTEPLIEYYQSKNLLVDIDSSPAPDAVFKTVLNALS